MASSGQPTVLPHPITSYQPLTLIIKLYKTTGFLVRLPIWLVKYLFPGLRPHSSWTYKQSIMRHMVYDVGGANSIIGITIPLRLTPGAEGARWALTPRFTDELYVGPLVSQRIAPVDIGGTWYGIAKAPSSPADASSWTRVSLHIHGGAFVIGDGRSEDAGFLGATLSEHARFDAVFVPQYRLSGYGGRDPFPAALQDAVTAWLYLTRTLEIPAERITVSGDSAGGNLTIGLLRYLQRFGEELNVPKPKRVVLVSPWVNPGEVLQPGFRPQQELAKTDYLPNTFPRWGARTYIAQSDNAGVGNEWVDPLGHPFVTDTAVFVLWAEREMLSVEVAKWAEEWKAAGNEKLTTYLEKDAPHDNLLLGYISGWDATARESARQIGKWVDEN